MQGLQPPAQCSFGQSTMSTRSPCLSPAPAINGISPARANPGMYQLDHLATSALNRAEDDPYKDQVRRGGASRVSGEMSSCPLADLRTASRRGWTRRGLDAVGSRERSCIGKLAGGRFDAG